MWRELDGGSRRSTSFGERFVAIGTEIDDSPIFAHHDGAVIRSD